MKCKYHLSSIIFIIRQPLERNEKQSLRPNSYHLVQGWSYLVWHEVVGVLYL